MKDELVSIIVAVYNSSAFLNKCVDSLLNQKYEHIEIILVNDGSKDDSENICLEYQDQDSRVHYFFKKNGGASSARNYGIQQARGKFVTFVDSDDYVGRQYVYDLLSAYDGHDSTFVIAGMKLKKRNDISDFVYRNEIVEKSNILEDIQKKQLYLHGGPTSKLFCLSIIKEHHISFNASLKNYEDMIFCLNYISHVSTIKYIQSTEYVYNLDNMSMGLTLNGLNGELLLYDLFNESLGTIDKNYLTKTPKTAMYGNVFLIRALLAFSRNSKGYNRECKRIFSTVHSKIHIKKFDLSVSKKQHFAFSLLRLRCFMLLYYALKLF